MRRRVFLASLPAAAAAQDIRFEPKGRLKQAVTRGVFDPAMPFEETCRIAAQLGCKGYDLIGPQDWPALKKFGLVPTMYPAGAGGTIASALNRPENHQRIEKSLRAAINQCAAFGAPSVITFSGNRQGMPDQEGADHCVAFLNNLKTQAEDQGVNICLELLNSKVNHPDYMADHTAWGVGVMKRVNSPRVKLLYDIYHMQIMEGDICRTIRENIQWIGHFHTGGNPGRHEIDDSQELNYRFIAKTIADLGFTGYVAHEYSPARPADALKSLNHALEIFDI